MGSQFNYECGELDWSIRFPRRIRRVVKVVGYMRLKFKGGRGTGSIS